MSNATYTIYKTSNLLLSLCPQEEAKKKKKKSRQKWLNSLIFKLYSKTTHFQTI